MKKNVIKLDLQIFLKKVSALTPAMTVPVPKSSKRNRKYVCKIIWKNDWPWLSKEWNFVAWNSFSLRNLLMSSNWFPLILTVFVLTRLRIAFKYENTVTNTMKGTWKIEKSVFLLARNDFFDLVLDFEKNIFVLFYLTFFNFLETNYQTKKSYFLLTRNNFWFR